jgi:hypothetical protein
MNKRTQARINAADHDMDLPQHQRRCTICHHPDREAIEEAFLQWRSPFHLRSEFKLPSRTTIYRHAHALGLFEKRRRNIRFALENIIEESESVRPTANDVIAAVRASACLQDNGEWLEPATTHRVITGVTPGTTMAFAASNVGTAAHPLTPSNSAGASVEARPAMDSNTQPQPLPARSVESDDSTALDSFISGQESEILIGTQVQTGNAATH